MKKVKFDFRVCPIILEKVRASALKSGVCRSELIRRFIADGLDNERRDAVPLE